MALQETPQKPPLFTATPESLIKDTKRLIQQTRDVQDLVSKDVTPETATFQNTLLPLISNDHETELEKNILKFYQDVSTDSKLRDASQEAESLFEAADIETYFRNDLHSLIDAVVKNTAADDLDPESRKLLERIHRKFVFNGLGLPKGEKRARFEEIKQRLSKLQGSFNKNLSEEDGGVWFSCDDLDGVPQGDIDSFEKDNDDPNMRRASLQWPNYISIQNYAKSGETRKRMFLAFQNRCPENVPIMKDIFVLRDEAARLLGYSSHAELRIGDRMFSSVSAIEKFLQELQLRLSQHNIKDIDQMKQMKAADVGSEDFEGQYYLWDERLYDRIIKEKQFSFDAMQVAEYFPVQSTVRGILNIFEKLFGLSFVEDDGKDRDRYWHEDVALFHVWDSKDRGGEFVGYLYMDLYPRYGKYNNASNHNLQPGFLNSSGSRSYPATALLCGFPKPTPDKPSLLKHSDVVMLFHELGHGIHDLVSQTKYACFHGTRLIDDFCETPSLMLENWFWIPSVLASLSQHYSTLSPEYLEIWKKGNTDKTPPPKKLSDEIIQSVIRTRRVNSALTKLRLIHIAMFDIAVHTPQSANEIKDLNISELYNRLWVQIVGLLGPQDQGHEWGHGEATLTQLIDGYDVGFYGYIISEVYALDMFEAFFKADPMSTTEGYRYRDVLLKKGGSQDEMDVLVEFLGREPSPEAFYRELGFLQ